MSIDPLYILYTALFIGVLLFIEGIYYLIQDSRGGTQATVNRRLRMLATGESSAEILRKLRRQSEKTGIQMIAQILPRFDQMITHAGLTIPVTRMLTIMGGLSLVVFVGLLVLKTFAVGLALVIAGAVGVGLPILYLSRRKRLRLKRFGEQLPDALDLIVRSLRAGHPINSAMTMVATEMADPIGTEFGIVVDEMTYGLDLRAALHSLAKRVPQGDLQFMIVTIEIQHATGGDLSEVLAGLADVIRDRFRIFLKISSVSAEGRFSARLVSALPFLVGGAVMVLNPTYFMAVSDDPLFIPYFAAAFVWMMIGNFIMWRMVNFRV